MKESRVIVFDSASWRQEGDVEDNSKFWKTATIIDQRADADGDILLDIMFDDGRISRGRLRNSTISLHPILVGKHI